MNTLNWSIRQYNQWCLEKIHGYEPKYAVFSKLLTQLWSIPYRYNEYRRGSDIDRYKDGLDLRQTYAEITGDDRILYWDNDCSVMEMLIALAIKIDWGIMGIPTEDKTYYWFWLMIHNLHLSIMTDDNYDEFYISEVIDDWLERRIEYNGKRGIFPLNDPEFNQKYETTWDQLNSYLKERG